MKHWSRARWEYAANAAFWTTGGLGIASGLLGILDLGRPSGIAGALAAMAGMLAGAATNRAAKVELEEIQAKMRSQAVAFASAL